MQLEKGIFTISLDFELIWGTMDRAGVERFAPACRVEREVVIDRLLDLFSKYDVSATWCILGHLFLDRCSPSNGRKHPEITRPNHAWMSGDWFANDPATTEADAPLFYGRSLIEKIRRARVPQEIASHSFSHIIFGDRGCSAAAARTDLEACVDAADRLGISLQSFAYPRNSVGYRDLLKEFGFRAYRGPEPHWYEVRKMPRLVRRLAHFLSSAAATTPPVVEPEFEDSGLWNIAGSMMYFPMHGVRAAIPVSQRVKRAIRGLERAARERKIFHLWFHPTNLADHTEELFEGLENILSRAASLARQGALRIAQMRQIVDEAERSTFSSSGVTITNVHGALA